MMINDTERFDNAKNSVIGKKHNDNGIGTLSEKTIHAVLKNYYEPDKDCQEIPIEGYVADIFRDNAIIEIQTRGMDKLRDKLAVFLNLYPVTVVHPIPCNKWLMWIDEETGEISKKRKTPKKGTAYDAFYELYKIKDFLKNPNLTIELVMLDVEEYRNLNGWSRDKKRGSTRYDRIPISIDNIITLEQPEDYMQFVPYELDKAFTRKEFAKAANIPDNRAWSVINILINVGVLKTCGKQGRALLYSVDE